MRGMCLECRFYMRDHERAKAGICADPSKQIWLDRCEVDALYNEPPRVSEQCTCLMFEREPVAANDQAQARARSAAE